MAGFGTSSRSFSINLGRSFALVRAVESLTVQVVIVRQQFYSTWVGVHLTMFLEFLISLELVQAPLSPRFVAVATA